jgi:hypothetical protein
MEGKEELELRVETGSPGGFHGGEGRGAKEVIEETTSGGNEVQTDERTNGRTNRMNRPSVRPDVTR